MDKTNNSLYTVKNFKHLTNWISVEYPADNGKDLNLQDMGQSIGLGKGRIAHIKSQGTDNIDRLFKLLFEKYPGSKNALYRLARTKTEKEIKALAEQKKKEEKLIEEFQEEIAEINKKSLQAIKVLEEKIRSLQEQLIQEKDKRIKLLEKT